MYGGTISGNKADLGGICVLEGGVLNLGGGVYANKNALTAGNRNFRKLGVKGQCRRQSCKYHRRRHPRDESSLNMKNSSVSQNTSGGYGPQVFM